MDIKKTDRAVIKHKKDTNDKEKGADGIASRTRILDTERPGFGCKVIGKWVDEGTRAQGNATELKNEDTRRGAKRNTAISERKRCIYVGSGVARVHAQSAMAHKVGFETM